MMVRFSIGMRSRSCFFLLPLPLSPLCHFFYTEDGVSFSWGGCAFICIISRGKSPVGGRVFLVPRVSRYLILVPLIISFVVLVCFGLLCRYSCPKNDGLIVCVPPSEVVIVLGMIVELVFG